MQITPPRTVSVSEVKSKILQPSLTSHYVVQIKPPPVVGNFISQRLRIDDDLINLSCSEASLPGSTLLTHEINNDYTGVTEKHAYRRLYDERADFTFYVDSNYTVIELFEGWINYIVGEGSPKSTDDYRKPTQNYRMKFPDGDGKDDGEKTGYRSSIAITKFERENRRSGNKLTYEFIKAYPISITSMPVSYDASNLLKCTVSFTYLRYIRGISKLGPLTTSKAGSTTGQTIDFSKDPAKINSDVVERFNDASREYRYPPYPEQQELDNQQNIQYFLNR